MGIHPPAPPRPTIRAAIGAGVERGISVILWVVLLGWLAWHFGPVIVNAVL